ncbi:MAG TPA: Ig-like domain-containing protein, partial [Clostridiales bacterium]|nr:Ig-like domain-containing protein [Clostridiales bacterium]
ESMDSTGVKPDSSYMLKSQNNITLDKIKNLLSIDGEPAPEIIQKDHNLFRITPSSPLEQNKLYVFRIKQEDGYDITWTFQTSAMFKITSSFPDDKTTNVPVNTGIEIYFSHEEYEDPSNYFEIIPKVKGSFERHKKALVFVPQELKKATLYTVKIKKGVKLANTDYELKDDYVFMFETSADENEENGNTYKGYFSYNRLLNEYTPNEIPHLPFNFYLRQEKVKKNSIKINTQVYAYSSLESFINAIAEKDKVPSWAYYSYVKNQIPVKGLQKVLEFQQEFNNPSHGEQFIKLPQNLAEGYYLVNSNWDDITFQTLMQITDVGMYLMQAEEKTLIWLNDLSTGKPVEGAEITIAGGNVEMHGNNQNSIKFYSNEDGIAYFDTPKDIHVTDEEQQQNYYQPSYYTERKYFKIITKDNKAAVLGYSSYIYNNGRYSTNYYWRFLHTDRNLYKPDDTVCFWGFIQNRYEGKNIDKLTVEVTKSNYRPMAYMYAEDGGRRKSYIPPFTGNQPLVKQIVELKNGVFTGELQLPFLEPGSYLLVLKNDRNIIINSTYIQIKNFTKPPYKLDITKDKEAVFPGQEANFNIKASFFEGTGVPDLAINYNIGSSTGENSISGNPTTDSTGSVSIKYTPQPPSQAQGENQAYFTCHSTLPEIGAINQHDNLRVFVNDINVKLESSFINNVAIINAELNRITLDRINSGTANDHWDYLGEPVSGKALNGTIFKNTWVKIEDGQYYDYINKVTRKSYRYELKTETVKDNFVLTTGLDGKAKFEYPLPEITDGYYSAKVYCVDNSGRDMKFDTYFSSYPYYRYSYYDDNRYFLDGVKENYKIGETVELTYKKGRDILPKDGSYLFIKAQNGIKDFVLSSKSDYSTVVEEKDIPNIHIIGVYFNGITYVQSEYCNIVFDKKERDLVIEASSDKEAYKPGEEAIVKVNIKDKSGKPQKSAINISVVDEALFKLREQYVDTLDTLYMQISAGISNTYSSHQNSGVDIIGGTGMDGAERTKADNGALAMEKSSKSPSMANMALADVAFGGAGSDYLREIFKDTAFFKTIETDENGYGEYRFKLPDNVTSWRITLSGLTAGLFAGTNKTSLNVTLPFFINYTLNSTYLAGDKPVLGVNAYGSSLKKDETVYFEVRSSKDPNKFAKADGKAFERVNIPLWEFAEGKDDLIIKAFTINGSSDSIKHRVLTVNTYHQMEEAIYYNLEPGLVFEGGKTGNTRLIFSDKSTGAFLPELVSLSYTSGSRIDQRLSAKLASNIIEKYFKEEDITNIINLINRDESFKPSEYQV